MFGCVTLSRDDSLSVQQHQTHVEIGSWTRATSSQAEPSSEAWFLTAQNRLTTVLILSIWLALTDFALLTSMEIWTILPPQALGELAYLVHDDQLPSLRALALHPCKDASAVLNDTALCHLLEGIECLESFAIVDYIGNEAFQVLVTRHGPFLHRVVLELGPHELPSSHGDMGYVGSLCNRCPNLTHLDIPVQRALGGAREVQQYQYLGRLKHLGRLTLWLNVVGEDVPGTWQVDMLPDDSRGKCLEDILINAATDEDLVKSIFRRVSRCDVATFSGIRRHGSLQYLKIEPRRFRDMPELDNGETPTSDIVSWVVGTWICERHGQEEDGLLATELDAYRMWNEEVLDEMESSQGLSDRVWRRLWPDREGGWTANWHSFPLAEVEEDVIMASSVIG